MKRIAPVLVAVVIPGVIAAWGCASRGNDPEPGSVQSAQAARGADPEPAPVQSAQAIRGATPYFEIKDEPSPKLIVDEPLPEPLKVGVVSIQWRVENVQILPVFGKGALSISPRAGHLHINVDDLPWVWADAGNVNTITLAGMPPGPHKVRIDLSNPTHEIFPGQTKTVTFTVPERVADAPAHSH